MDRLINYFVIFCALFAVGIVNTQDKYYSVKPEVQHAEMSKAMNHCITIQQQETVSINQCATKFDTVMCWPRAQVNTTVVLPCPRYYNGFKVDGRVTKTCHQNREWSKTQYANCVEPHMWEYINNNNTQTQIDIVEKLGHLGYASSGASLALAIIIMLRFKKLHCPRNTIHIHLFCSFLLRAIFHFIRMPYPLKTLPEPVCRMLVVLENYLIETSYTWVFIEALFLHNTIFVHAFTDNSSWIWMYIILGWSLPCFVMSIWIGTRFVFENSSCWIIDQSNISRWILICYPTITILLNVFFFINITREIFLKLQHGPGNDRHPYRKLTKSTFVLVLVFGLYHLVFIPVELYGNNSSGSKLLRLIQLYYTHLLVTFQGLIVACIFCFVNGEVLKEIKRCISPKLSSNNRFTSHQNHKMLNLTRTNYSSAMPGTTNTPINEPNRYTRTNRHTNHLDATTSCVVNHAERKSMTDCECSDTGGFDSATPLIVGTMETDHNTTIKNQNAVIVNEG